MASKKSKVIGVKHPEIKVTLVGEDGNAFAILGRVRLAMKRGGAPKAEIEEFTREATSGDYDHLLATCIAWVEVE